MLIVTCISLLKPKIYLTKEYIRKMLKSPVENCLWETCSYTDTNGNDIEIELHLGVEE